MNVSAFVGPLRNIDFRNPPGEPALFGAQSVAWRVYKNPVALFIGGVSAVILELAEPRVRTGVWEHSAFRTDPVGRLQRTGAAAMASVYAARSVAEPVIRRVNRMHGEVRGATPDGVAYAADDPELLAWVQATAAFGFLFAYDRFVGPLSRADRDRFFAEGAGAARLYGVQRPLADEAGWRMLLAQMEPALEPHPIVLEFLGVMERVAAAPAPLRPLQRLMVRAAVSLTPRIVRERLGLGERWRLSRAGAALIRALGAASDRIVLREAPPAQACQRLGLPANYLYR